MFPVPRLQLARVRSAWPKQLLSSLVAALTGGTGVVLEMLVVEEERVRLTGPRLGASCPVVRCRSGYGGGASTSARARCERGSKDDPRPCGGEIWRCADLSVQLEQRDGVGVAG
jgi:hypothetical protein